MHLRSPRKPIKRALALEYDGVGAPRLTAKGAGEIAEKIIAIAQEAEVPLYEDPHLAAALSQLELGDPVPEILYRAIAEVLAFVYDMESLQSKMAAQETKK
ncbi:EscU/YscU/HrcU family type III secretion system export apparatus switch protein [Marinospirillum sp.]|uniref:EscU/YscU/HrcU family type III secretion system export apparatus switch protein n=1 Tax=Marinospirillum sp. TaxID=2183934 RepID=UPI003A852329